jgi:hypothetical protein
MGEYARSLSELKENAVLFWPKDVLEKEAAVSVLPLLLRTQDKFISLLNLSDAGPESWISLLDHSAEMKDNIFLKHLMVLTDLAGEALNKLTPFSKFFDDGIMNYVWQESNYSYQFTEVSRKTTLTNTALRVDGKSLLRGYELSAKMRDVAMLLIHGASAYGDSFPSDSKEKCMLGSLIGQPALLNDFVKQSYIRVSTQLRGASSNAMGQIAQKYVAEVLTEELQSWSIKSGHVPGISHDNGGTETTFDIVAKSPNGKYFAIEVSFQFTTNSVIERKAGQAQARARLLHEQGHYICYVIDGAGNINVRERAVAIICQFSDCTVAFSKDELHHLADFLRKTDDSGS